MAREKAPVLFGRRMRVSPAGKFYRVLHVSPFRFSLETVAGDEHIARVFVGNEVLYWGKHATAARALSAIERHVWSVSRKILRLLKVTNSQEGDEVR